MTFQRCIMILADGTRADCFTHALAEGRLPRIAEHITSRGGNYRGVTAFPSTTGPAYMPFLTGCGPGRCNVPGIRWFEKSRFIPGVARGARSYVGVQTFRINQDLSDDVQTLFEIFPKSYNIFNAVNRGVQFSHNLTRMMRIWHWYYAHLTDRWAFVDEEATRYLTRAVAKDFEFIFVVLPGVDEYSHLDNPLGTPALASYAAVDRAVGAAADILREDGRLEDTLWWIVSDHGLSATHTHCSLDQILASCGFKTLAFPGSHRFGCDAANMMSGNGMSHLYLRHPSGWKRRYPFEEIARDHPRLLDALFAQPAVDLLAVRAHDGGVELLSRAGRAHLAFAGDSGGPLVDAESAGSAGDARFANIASSHDAEIIYTPLTGDPLALGGAARFTREASLTRTHLSRYPDAPYQLLQLFASPRAGDIVVSATPGYDLRLEHENPEHRGSHGSLEREHMIVPVLTNLQLTTPVLRTIDVFPTTLAAMHRPLPQIVEGVSRI